MGDWGFFFHVFLMWPLREFFVSLLRKKREERRGEKGKSKGIFLRGERESEKNRR